MLLWAQDWAKLSMKLPHCVCESMTGTLDKACILSLGKSDQSCGSILSLLKMSFSYPQCLIFCTLGRLRLCAFCFLVFLVMFLLLVREKSGHRYSNDRSPNETIVFGDQMLLHCQLVHLSVGLYQVKTVDLVFICLWVDICSMYVRLFWKVEEAMLWISFHYQIRNFRQKKEEILEGEKNNISVHLQLCIECAFLQAFGQKPSVRWSMTQWSMCITSFLSSFPERFSKCFVFKEGTIKKFSD